MRRVLKPGGRALVIDLRKDVNKKALDDYIRGLKVGILDALVMKWTFRLMLIGRAYTKQQFGEFISQSGFETPKFGKRPSVSRLR